MNNKIELLGDNSIRIAVVGVLAILALFLFTETASVAQDLNSPTSVPADTITVAGTGQVALARTSRTSPHGPAVGSNRGRGAAAATKQATLRLPTSPSRGIADKDVTTLS